MGDEEAFSGLPPGTEANEPGGMPMMPPDPALVNPATQAPQMPQQGPTAPEPVAPMFPHRRSCRSRNPSRSLSQWSRRRLPGAPCPPTGPPEPTGALVLQPGSSVTYFADHAALGQAASFSRSEARSRRVKRHWNGLAAD